MAHAGRAAVFIHAIFADDHVTSFDRADFAEFCQYYGIQERVRTDARRGIAFALGSDDGVGERR
ncbi:MAG: hypothetical protein ACREUE_17655 [Panacagrimonas sp.]